MTPMDSDSESQDSDEGRRFRFEATRKDPVTPVDTSSRTKSPKKKSKHKSQRDDSGSRHYRERKERSKHESTRKTDDKDLRHLIKHTKHDSRSGSRQEEGGKNLHKNHRDARDASSANDRGSRHSSGDGARERSRDSKRQSDRDWNVHRAQRSREHSHERNHDELRGSSDRHRSRCRERYKHRSRDRSRERSHQSAKVKSSSGDRSREDYGKSDTSKKLSVKENRSQNSRDYSSPKSTERARSHSSETRSALLQLVNEDTKKESSSDVQDCKELDLSQFDVLSETDDNTSDGPDSRCRTLSLRHREAKPPRDFSEDRSEPPEKRARAEQRREGRKVKARNDDDDRDGNHDAPASSNNNPSAVSDSSLVPCAAISEKTGDTRADSAREKPEEEITAAAHSGGDAKRSSPKERHSRQATAVPDGTRSCEKLASGPTYGPLLASGLTSRRLADERFETRCLDSGRESHKKMISDDDVDNGEKTRVLIGPCLPPSAETKSVVEPRADGPREREIAADHGTTSEDVDMAFGPALPPHLLQRMRDKESRGKIIGPVLPDVLKRASHEAESDDESDAIGPLPADHPALRNSRVHEQLDIRAHRIRREGYSDEVDPGNKREEWMTELPPAQAASLGLGPRKFRLKEGPDMSDRSCWTDTPVQKAQKQRDSETAKRLGHAEEADRRRAKERHKKEADRSSKREKSLLEIHQSKMAKKKRKEEEEAKLSGKSTRRPFDRDIDLQANRFDQAQKKSILMKAQMLDDRFSRGEI